MDSANITQGGRRLTAWGWGLASIDERGNTLDVWYPKPELVRFLLMVSAR